jgi:hypothetical protein
MPGKTPDRVSYAVECTCGAKHSLDARAFGRPRVCKNCGSSFTVAWGRGSKWKKPVPVVVAQARARAGVGGERSPFAAACACGYRRPVSEREATVPPKCPGCGKVMRVERVGGAVSSDTRTGRKKPAPNAPPLPLHLRPPQKVAVPVGARVMTCPCGERLLLRPTSFGKPTQCPNCDRWLLIEEQASPTIAAPRPTAVRRAPPAPARPAPSFARQPGPGECLCPCGAIIPPRTSRTGLAFACAACGRKGRVEQAGDGGLKAVVTEEAAPKPPAPAASAPAPAAPEEGPQSAICECGAELVVSKEDVGTPQQCPGCDTVLAVEEAPDPLGGPPGLRIRKVELGTDESLNLEDFR